ncbi:MAG: hypothetical protein RLZZ77_1336 [Bacteroidota bacterium]|jgi:hypothetical protein
MASTDLIHEAWSVLTQCSTTSGIMASPNHADNYRRIWSRDAMMAGVASVFHGHESMIAVHRSSIITLMKAQAFDGQLPSNVTVEEKRTSFGGLAGRVDATTWWLVGAGVYLLHSKDDELKTHLAGSVERAFQVLHSWEMNHGGFIYTPLGGNWADEYICQGYVLYDQLVRLWALRLHANVYQRSDWKLLAEQLTKRISDHFSSDGKQEAVMHPRAFEKAKEKEGRYWWFQFGPQGYDTRFDLAANALALLLGFDQKIKSTAAFLNELAVNQQSWMIPAFYPTIQQGDAEWSLLAENYAYDFKNFPGHFHNGGAWPIFMGWMIAALNLHNERFTATAMQRELEHTLVSNTHQPFFEYWHIKEKKAGGKFPLAYSATGCLLANLSPDQMETIKIYLQ